MNDLLDWAKREVELACKKENPNRKDGEFDYGCACYESALKAFESLMQDEHSGYSIMVTKNILNRLIAHKPLTPIVDTEDVWNKTINRQEGCISYQCKRIPSLFKDVYNNGVIKYDDINRIIMTCDGKTFFHSGFIKKSHKNILMKSLCLICLATNIILFIVRGFYLIFLMDILIQSVYYIVCSPMGRKSKSIVILKKVKKK